MEDYLGMSLYWAPAWTKCSLGFQPAPKFSTCPHRPRPALSTVLPQKIEATHPARPGIGHYAAPSGEGVPNAVVEGPGARGLTWELVKSK